SFGLPVSYGGPGVGLFATHERHVRSMAGRIVGETVDARGRRGFVLTLATREQHIRRERATSNICTNQGLCALAVAIHLSLLGRHGLRAVAALNYRAAHAVADRLASGGVVRRFAGPFFNEFVVRAPRGRWEALVQDGVIAGFPLARWYPELEDALLLCVTEAHAARDVDRLVPGQLAQGALELIAALEHALAAVSGLDAVSLQPAAGAQGELLGMLLIRAYHTDRGDPRRRVLIPSSAHGTNPASAALCGY